MTIDRSPLIILYDRFQNANFFRLKKHPSKTFGQRINFKTKSVFLPLNLDYIYVKNSNLWCIKPK